MVACLYTPAATGNYALGRAGHCVETIVLHTMEGFAKGTARWFADTDAEGHGLAHASAHYGIDVDGQLYRYVNETDTAWHAGNRDVNRRSIGIELEGHSDDPDLMTDKMFDELVHLVADICSRYAIPIDRQHIVGHCEVPDPRHAMQFGGIDHHHDPGPHFPWAKFMARLAPPQPIALQA